MTILRTLSYKIVKKKKAKADIWWFHLLLLLLIELLCSLLPLILLVIGLSGTCTILDTPLFFMTARKSQKPCVHTLKATCIDMLLENPLTV